MTAFGTRPWTGNPIFFPKTERPKVIRVEPHPPGFTPPTAVIPIADSGVLDRRDRTATRGEKRAYDRGYRAGFQHGQQSATMSMLADARDGRSGAVVGDEGGIVAIAMQVALAYGFSSWREIRAHRRETRILYARQHAMWRCVNETTCSTPQIGRVLGGFDHSTVIHACRAHEERMRKASLTGNVPTV